MLYQTACPSHSPFSHHSWPRPRDTLLGVGALLPTGEGNLPFSSREPWHQTWRSWLSSWLLHTWLQTAPVPAGGHGPKKASKTRSSAKSSDVEYKFKSGQTSCTIFIHQIVLLVTMKIGHRREIVIYWHEVFPHVITSLLGQKIHQTHIWISSQFRLWQKFMCVSLQHHTLCQTETYIYCIVDRLQPYSWRGRKKKKKRETGWDGLRQQRFWECSDLDAESKSESAKDFPHHLWNTWEKMWAQTLWSHAEVHRLLGASISLVCWKL